MHYLQGKSGQATFRSPTINKETFFKKCELKTERAFHRTQSSKSSIIELLLPVIRKIANKTSFSQILTGLRLLKLGNELMVRF